MRLTERVNPDFILDTVVSVLRIKKIDAISKTRKGAYVEARQIYSYIACKYGFQNIAHELIKQDHSTVSYSKLTIEGFLKLKGEYRLRKIVSDIDNILKAEIIGYPCEIKGVCKYAATGYQFNIPIEIEQAEPQPENEVDILTFTVNL